MPSAKTQIDPHIVSNFLNDYFHKNITLFEPIKGGEFSQAFSFMADNKNYIIRINKQRYSFDKDKFAFEHFASPKIPIPKIFDIGKIREDYFFAISKPLGKDLRILKKDISQKLLPQIITTLDAIHEIDISTTSGYGYWWKGEDKGEFNSYKDWLLFLRKDSEQLWEYVFSKSFVDKTYINKIFDRLEVMSQYVSEERKLIHGDYGFNNLISDGEKITGVIDWGESRYGDFMHDIAWLDFWTEDIDYAKEFKKHYDDSGIVVQNYEERLLCYDLYIGVHSLGFAGRSDDEKDYLWVKKRIDELIH